MARKLQDRLALASYKAQHGQASLSFNDVEARLESTISRKRPNSSMDSSSSSSSSSGQLPFPTGIASSPIMGPIFSDEISTSDQKYLRASSMFPSAVLEGSRAPSKRPRSKAMAPPLYEASRNAWKSNYNLAQSSPTYRRHDTRYTNDVNLSQSFASDVSTVPDSPSYGRIHDDDEHDHLPLSSFRIDSSNFNSSPPRTPPPTRQRSHKSTGAGGEEGADLLLFFAGSPSPANPGRHARVMAPSTPPTNAHALPSSMLSTPGLAGFNTPGQPFNFSDFINVTPSPAQGAFGSRTPGLTKTPLAAKEARRRLNFDSLLPPTGNHSVGRTSAGKESGLGMDLGGELVSSQ